MRGYYGLLSHIETGITPERYTDLEKYAEHLLSTLDKVTWEGSVSAPNINTIRWGDPIHIYEPITGLVGQFYVTASRHVVDESGSRMELALHYERKLPEILFEKFEKDTSRESDNPLIEAADEIYRGGRSSETGAYITPLREYSITQDYGANPNTKYNRSGGHTGIDMAKGQEIGTAIRAVQSGVVESAGWAVDGLGGNQIIINHEDGYRTLYAHCNTIVVKAGVRVSVGQVIGTVGQTGSADPAVNPGGGPHVHFQVMRGSVIINPRDLVPIKPRANA
jgi:murein DD-endopeptidase MepM/ murein hydrolase activator NlpD